MKKLAVFLALVVVCTSCTMGFKGDFACGYDGHIKQLITDEEDNR